MSSVQERLQLKRVPLDKWSIQEQLCLASAVACSGDQNWMSVSRSLKMLCSSNRPSDWFSQKSCAAQYGKLLENVETPKRKKRTLSERDNAIVETPSELIVRKLTQERITELKKIILDEQQLYLKLKEDILTVQTADDSRLREMWTQIETENKQKDKERSQHSLWLKEREERKLEMERAWRPGNVNFAVSGVSLPGTPAISPSTLNLVAAGLQSLPQSYKTPLSLKIKTEDTVDIDEPLSQSSTVLNKQGTSPLLTSLLKSPNQQPISTVTTTPINVVHTIVTSQQFPSNATRNAAPTITNLLTSNIISTTQSSDVKCSLSAASTESNSSTLLLEPTESDSIVEMESKNLVKKEIKREVDLFTDLTVESPSSNGNDSSKDDDQQLMEVFNGLIPDNIDELADILTQTNAIISLSPELLEEGSILGNADSLINSHGEVEHESNVKENIATKNKIENVDSKARTENSKNENILEREWIDEVKQIKDKGETEKQNIVKLDNDSNFNQQTTASSLNPNVVSPIPVETTDFAKHLNNNSEQSNSNDETQILNFENSKDRDVSQPSSPQSSENDIMIIEDNTPPASEQNATVESKNHPTVDPTNAESMAETSLKNETTKCVNFEIVDDETKMIIEVNDENDQKENKGYDSKTDSKVDQCDTKIEKSQQDITEITIKSNQSSIDKSDDDNFEEINEDLRIVVDCKRIQDNTQSISLIDTDDDSPIEVIKEDKSGKQKRDYSRKKLDNQKNDDNNIDEINKASLSLRMKLKERDRSESPFVLDDDNDDIPRTRRRYSSTPNIDSIPNSPASSITTNDDRDYKLWKKSVLIAFNRIQMHKHSSIFLKLAEQYSNYKIILRPIDLIAIKKNVETEVIRSTAEFQRDIMLMCYNLIYLNSKMYLTVKEFLQDALNTIDITMDSTRKDEKIGMSGGSTGGSSTSSHLNQSQSSSSSLFSTTSGKGRGGRKSSRMSNI